MTLKSEPTDLPASKPGDRVLLESRNQQGHQPESKRLWWGLIWTLVRTDFKIRYHGTWGGFVWALAKPLTMFLVLLGIFSLIFQSDPDYKLNLIVGLFLWDFFSESTKTGLGSLHSKGFLVTKAKFPSWIVIITSASNAVITLGVFAVIMIGFIAFFQSLPDLQRIGLFMLYQLHFLAMVIGISLATSVLFPRYRDLDQVWDMMLQAGFFVAPIIYPLGILPERFHIYLFLWPPTSIIQFSRSVLISGEIPTGYAHLCLFTATVSILTLGILTYRQLGKRAAEYL